MIFLDLLDSLKWLKHCELVSSMPSVLSTAQIKQIKQWKQTHTKPLCLVGHDGCGKTTVAKECLKSYHIIELSIDSIKSSKDILEPIHNSLMKQDILQMVLGKQQYKALLIDDIQHYAKYDRSTLQKIVSYVKTLDFNKYPVIFVCNHYTDKITSMIYSMCEVITIQFNMRKYKTMLNNQLTTDQIRKSDKNLYGLSTHITMKQSSTVDKQYNIQSLLKQCFLQTDLFQLCSSEYTIISLNLLENLSQLMYHLDPSVLFEIYRSVCIDDFIQTKYISYSLPSYLCVLYSCYTPRQFMKQTLTDKFQFVYNSYLSRSIIQVYNQQLIRSSRYPYLTMLLELYNGSLLGKEVSKGVIEQWKSCDIKIAEKQLKLFNYLYNKTWSKTKLQKAIKNIVTTK